MPYRGGARHRWRGVVRRRVGIFTNPTTAVLDRLVRTAPGLTQRSLDGKVAGVAKGRSDGQVVEHRTVWHRGSTARYAPVRRR